MTAAANAERRRAVADAIADRLRRLDPVFGDVTGLHVRVFFRPDGQPRAVIIEPEFRSEST